jgi:hypothetical protein
MHMHRGFNNPCHIYTVKGQQLGVTEEERDIGVREKKNDLGISTVRKSSKDSKPGTGTIRLCLPLQG